MKNLIVTFELTNPGFNYERVVQRIKSSSPYWARLTGNSYLIVTNLSTETVRNNIVTVLHKSDRVFVSACPVPAAWYGLPDDVGKWILENQPKNS
jgi:hypothetical protein